VRGIHIALHYAALAVLAVVLNFVLIRAAPGSPFAGLDRDELAAVLTEDQKQALSAHYGLNRPLPVQLTAYLTRLARADLGISLYFQEPVAEVILPYLSRTALLVALGFLAATMGGLVLGVLSATGHRLPWGRVLLVAMTTLHALPPFLLAMLILLGFAVSWPLFPATATLLPGEPLSTQVRRFVLPVAAYALWELGLLCLLVRGAVLDVLGEPFVTYARAKGLPERRILVHHVLRAAAPPIISRAAVVVGVSFGGVFFVERVFAYPGIGTLALVAQSRFDYPLLEGIFLVSLGAILLCNFTSDLLVARLDPRLRAL